MPSPPASESMWPASESSASEPEMRPAANSTATKEAVSRNAISSGRRWRAPRGQRVGGGGSVAVAVAMSVPMAVFVTHQSCLSMMRAGRSGLPIWSQKWQVTVWSCPGREICGNGGGADVLGDWAAGVEPAARRARRSGWGARPEVGDQGVGLGAGLLGQGRGEQDPGVGVAGVGEELVAGGDLDDLARGTSPRRGRTGSAPRAGRGRSAPGSGRAGP